MRDTITVSVKVVNGDRWADLNAFGISHEFCGETVSQRKDLSFAGGHRVRLYLFKKNVHWRIPHGTQLDIRDVDPAQVPRRRHGQ